MKYRLLKNKETGIRVIFNTITKEKIYENENPKKYKELRKKALNNLKRKEKDDCLKSLGLVKTPYGWE